MPKHHREFLGLYANAIIYARNVQHQEVAVQLDSEAKEKSIVRRIQRFFSSYILDYEHFATMQLLLIPPGKVKICMDRTNWNVGSTTINFLVVTVYARGVGIPIWFELLDNQGGNSHTRDRIRVLKKCIEFLGQRIECFIADREFIGKQWIKYLLQNHQNFFIRLRQNQWVEIDGESIQIMNLLKNKAEICEFDNVGIFGTYLSLGVKYLPLKKEYLAVVTNTFGNLALDEYENRWSIEVTFQSVKGRGFNLENTHLQDFIRLRQLFAVCSLAMTICFHVGCQQDEEDKRIPIKNHGYKGYE